MSMFSKCPNCNNEEEGAEIWTCGDCGCVHCKDCDDDGACPKCGGSEMNHSGEIGDDNSSDDTSAEYSECPRCSKNTDGDSIWQCKDCDCVHCKDCDPDSGNCPSCGSRRVKKIGEINN